MSFYLLGETFSSFKTESNHVLFAMQSQTLSFQNVPLAYISLLRNQHFAFPTLLSVIYHLL